MEITPKIRRISMKTAKRILCLILASLMVVSLATTLVGCDDDGYALSFTKKKTDKEIGELSGAELAAYIDKMRKAKK